MPWYGSYFDITTQYTYVRTLSSLNIVGLIRPCKNSWNTTTNLKLFHKFINTCLLILYLHMKHLIMGSNTYPNIITKPQLYTFTLQFL